MELLLRHIEANWGKMPACNHCAKEMTPETMFCAGPCVGTFYCNKQCQSNDWAQHHAVCIGVKTGDKRGRDEEEEEDEIGVPSKQIKIEELPLPHFDRNVWSTIAKYLNLEDLKKLTLMQKRLMRIARQKIFEQYWIKAPEKPEKLREFLTEARENGLIGFIRYFSYVTPENLTLIDSFPKIFPEIELHGLWLWVDARRRDVNNIQLDQLPGSLKVLIFHSQFNQPITRLPPRLEVLKFGREFNRDIEEYPAGLQRVTFGHSFNRPINNLPMSVQYLQLGYSFNQFVENWPSELKTLMLGFNFNQFIHNLPDGLEKLLFSAETHSKFNARVNNWPGALEELQLSSRFNKDISNLPPTLKRLTLGRHYIERIENFPEQLEMLRIGYYNITIINWPPNLKEFNIPGDSEFNRSIDDLPDTVEIIAVGRGFNTRVNKTPRNLRILYLVDYCRQKKLFPPDAQEKAQLRGGFV